MIFRRTVTETVAVIISAPSAVTLFDSRKTRKHANEVEEFFYNLSPFSCSQTEPHHPKTTEADFFFSKDALFSFSVFVEPCRDKTHGPNKEVTKTTEIVKIPEFLWKEYRFEVS